MNNFERDQNGCTKVFAKSDNLVYTRTFPVFYAVCERGVLTAMYDFAFHIRGADCVSRNRAYNLVDTRDEGGSAESEIGQFFEAFNGGQHPEIESSVNQ